MRHIKRIYNIFDAFSGKRCGESLAVSPKQAVNNFVYRVSSSKIPQSGETKCYYALPAEDAEATTHDPYFDSANLPF